MGDAKKKTPLKGQRFESLAAAQVYVDRWESRWADTRIHGTTKRQVAAMFAEEKSHLLPLPLETRELDRALAWHFNLAMMFSNAAFLSAVFSNSRRPHLGGLQINVLQDVDFTAATSERLANTTQLNFYH